MTYEEFMDVYDILLEKGFVKWVKPMWNMNVYEMVKEINEDYNRNK